MAEFNPVGASVLVLLGGIFAYQLVGSLQNARAFLTGTDPTSAGPGDLVVATGSPSLRSTLVDAPVSGEPCCGYLAVLQQRYRSRLIVRWHPDYVVGDLPRFTLTDDSRASDTTSADSDSTDDEDSIVVDLADAVNPVDPASSLGDIAPPGDRFSPLDIDLDATSDTIKADAPLPDRLSVFEDARKPSYPVRIREHRLNEHDELTVIGRSRTTDTEPTTIDADGLVYLTDKGSGHAIRRLTARVLLWFIATLVFLVPAVLYTYATLIA